MNPEVALRWPRLLRDPDATRSTDTVVNGNFVRLGFTSLKEVTGFFWMVLFDFYVRNGLRKSMTINDETGSDVMSLYGQNYTNHNTFYNLP